jgi:hypothetical protein
MVWRALMRVGHNLIRTLLLSTQFHGAFECVSVHAMEVASTACTCSAQWVCSFSFTALLQLLQLSEIKQHYSIKLFYMGCALPGEENQLAACAPHTKCIACAAC